MGIKVTYLVINALKITITVLLAMNIVSCKYGT